MPDILNTPLTQLAAWKENIRKARNKGFIDELTASVKPQATTSSESSG